MERTIRAGWFVFGVLAGLLVAIVCSHFEILTFNGEVPIVDLAQLVAALFLAMYIPFAVERMRDRQRYARDLLVSQVQEIVEGAKSVNDILSACAMSGETDDRSKMQVRARFLTCNFKLSRLAERLIKECGDECQLALDDFRKAYDTYFDAVTGGSLYGTGKVDWSTWRQQESEFVQLQNAGIDLTRFLSDR